MTHTTTEHSDNLTASVVTLLLWGGYTYCTGMHNYILLPLLS